ncbi:hypothetical protein FRC11_009785, partial [Ceratobasidium sp. 423]
KTELKDKASKKLADSKDYEMQDGTKAGPSTSTSPSKRDIKKMILSALAKEKAKILGPKTSKHSLHTPKKSQVNLGKGAPPLVGPSQKPLNPLKGGSSGGQTLKTRKCKASTQAQNTGKKSKKN